MTDIESETEDLDLGAIAREWSRMSRRARRARRLEWIGGRKRREKIFGLPIRDQFPLDVAAGRRLIARAVEWSRKHRQPGQHRAGPLTRATIDVLRALIFKFASRLTGSCFPSYDALAEAAHVNRSTAIDAVKRLEAAGFIKVFGRMARVRRRVLRTSNAYTFALNASAPPPEAENQAGTKDSKESENYYIPPRVIRPEVPPIIRRESIVNETDPDEFRRKRHLEMKRLGLM